MNDYERTWRLRQQYYSPEAVHAREDAAAIDREQRDQVAAARRLAPLAQQQDGPRQGRNVFGGAEDKSALFTPKPGSKEGDPLAQAKDFGLFASSVGEHAAEAVPAIGVGLIDMADAALDLGAHALGVESSYRDFAEWAGKMLPVYQPQTMTGKIVAPMTQVMAPYGGTMKLLSIARVSNFFTRAVVAGGVAEGVGLHAGADNLGDIMQAFEDVQPETATVMRQVLVDALAKTPAELQALAAAERTDESMEGTTLEGELDVDAYRDAYFSARLKNAVSGAALEGVAEGLFRATKLLYRVASTMARDPAAAARLSAVAVAGGAQVAATDEPDSAGAARGYMGSVVAPAEDALRLADDARAGAATRAQAEAMLPPDSRRAEGAAPRVMDLDLDAPGDPRASLTDEQVDAAWREALEFKRRQGYDAGSPPPPHDAAFWTDAARLPARHRYWNEVSAEALRQRLPDLSDAELEQFVRFLGITGQRTAPTQNLHRALGVYGQALRSEQDPAAIMQGLGAGEAGAADAMLHHLGLGAEAPLPASDVAEARFLMNLRDAMNESQGGEPWQTWQIQAAGAAQERIIRGGTDLDDYLDVLIRVGDRARDAGLPVGPDGELTRAVLADPRMEPILAATIADYRRRASTGTEITARGGGYHRSVAMRREFELLGDQGAVDEWAQMERAAQRQVVTGAALSRAVTGKGGPSVRTVAGGAASRIPLPAGATQTETEAYLAVMGQELHQGNVRAGRFRYLETPPEKLGDEHATSVIYERPEPLTAEQVQAFQQALGPGWQVDARVGASGSVLDVHPDGAIPARPEELDAAVEAAGLDPGAARVVFSAYSRVQVDASSYPRALARWRSDVVREEAEAFAAQFGGMGQIREVLLGHAPIAQDLPGGKALRERVSKAKQRIAERFAAMDEARDQVRQVRRGLDAAGDEYVNRNAERLERARAKRTERER